MRARVHAVAGTVAIVLIGLFMTATVGSELVGDGSVVLAVKTGILGGLVVLVPAVAVAGASGRSLGVGRSDPVLTAKRRRTTVAGAIGLLVLVPCAVVLQRLAVAGDLGSPFRVVQGVELVGGAVNLALLVRNARAGRMLAAARRARSRPDGAAVVR